MSTTFAQLYAPLSKDIFRQHAREQIAQGQDALLCARGYAEQGKPDFTLAFLLDLALPDQEKQELLALAFRKRAELTVQKAEQFERQFRRSFSLLKLEAENDRRAATSVLAGESLAPAETQE